MQVTAETLSREDNHKQNELDFKQFHENWIWRAAHCLVSSPEFVGSPKWSARRLNVSVEKIVEAFEGLERINAIRRDGNSYKVTGEYYYVGPKQQSLEGLLISHSRLAPQIASKLTTHSKYTSQFLLGDQQLINKYSPRFMALYREMEAEGIALGLKEVVASTVSFATLTEESFEGGAQ